MEQGPQIFPARENAGHFANANRGWVVGRSGNIDSEIDGHFGGNFHGGVIFATTDGGKTWSEQKRADGVEFRSVHFAGTNTGWVVGKTIGLYGPLPAELILATADVGRTWTKQNAIANGNLHSVYFANANTGWIVGVKSKSTLVLVECLLNVFNI